MITPAGKECRFYYQNFHRGASDQECRLLQSDGGNPDWRPGDCRKCPVPEILLANSSPDLVLEARVRQGVLGIGRRVEVKAFCSKHLIDVSEPRIGCPACAGEKPGIRELFGD